MGLSRCVRYELVLNRSSILISGLLGWATSDTSDATGSFGAKLVKWCALTIKSYLHATACLIGHKALVSFHHLCAFHST